VLHLTISRERVWIVLLAVLMLVRAMQLSGQAQKTLALPLDSTAGLEVVNGKAEVTSYRGRQALKIAPAPDHQPSDEIVMAIVTASDFKNGTIELDVAGSPRPSTPDDSRGFIGIAFRLRDHGARFENIYLRPTNGRADDQLRRNHSVQYESIPDFPWFRLRKENPGTYESYVDLEAGAWTKMKIVVSGTTARLYVNGAEQPCLIVNDLKLGESHGQIALWAHWATDAYFSNLTVHSE
jgi:3-keto-disaccharide hydrolase